jgi:hypothetical protein
MKKKINIFFISLIALSLSITKVQANKPECKICKQKSKTVTNCNKKINTTAYKGSYNKRFGFPVTVRHLIKCKDVHSEKYSLLPSF